MTAADLIRRRKALRLSQMKLAAKLGMDTSAVWRWETERVTPIPRWLDAVLFALEHGYEEETR